MRESTTTSPSLSQKQRAEIVPDFALVVAGLSDAILFLDRDWRISYANENAFRISRLSPTDLNNKTHWEIFPDTVGTELERKYRRAMDHRTEERIEFFYQRFELWIDLRVLPIESGIALHYRDVTVLRQAQQHRDSANRELQHVFEATTDAIVSLNRNWDFVFVNRRAQELFHLAGDLLGRNLRQTFPGAVYEGSPYVENLTRAMQNGIPVEFEAYFPEPLNGWFRIEARPSGNGVIVFFRDITEQREDADALRQRQTQAEHQRAELEAIYRTSPVGLALFDPVDFRFLRLNDLQAEMIGLPADQILGRTVQELAPDVSDALVLLREAAAGAPVRNKLIEGELPTRPGERRFWTVSYLPVFGPDGSIQAVTAATLEITQQKKAEAALIQSGKLAAVGRLASSISHEINNPLESVTNLLYLIEDHASLPEEVRAYVRTAQSELARVSQIATQTLRFHRQAVAPVPVTAAELVNPVLDLYRGRLANSGIAVSAEYRSATPVLCFENDIRQVVNNLIANAFDAMRSGGRLLVRAHDATEPVSGRRGIRIAIADTGHGMSAETQSHLYEPFFTTKELHGTGLGLWISSGIVHRHAGRLTVRSSQHLTCRGTIFQLFLPAEEV